MRERALAAETSVTNHCDLRNSAKDREEVSTCCTLYEESSCNWYTCKYKGVYGLAQIIPASNKNTKEEVHSHCIKSVPQAVYQGGCCPIMKGVHDDCANGPKNEDPISGGPNEVTDLRSNQHPHYPEQDHDPQEVEIQTGDHDPLGWRNKARHDDQRQRCMAPREDQQERAKDHDGARAQWV